MYALVELDRNLVVGKVFLLGDSSILTGLILADIELDIDPKGLLGLQAMLNTLNTVNYQLALSAAFVLFGLPTYVLWRTDSSDVEEIKYLVSKSTEDLEIGIAAYLLNIGHSVLH